MIGQRRRISFTEAVVALREEVREDRDREVNRLRASLAVQVSHVNRLLAYNDQLVRENAELRRAVRGLRAREVQAAELCLACAVKLGPGRHRYCEPCEDNLRRVGVNAR